MKGEQYNYLIWILIVICCCRPYVMKTGSSADASHRYHRLFQMDNGKRKSMFALPSPKKPRLDTDFNLCIICQEETDAKIFQIQSKSITTIRGAIEKRQDLISQRLKRTAYSEDFLSKHPKWHDRCRATWTCKRNIAFALSKINQNDDSQGTSVRSVRSSFEYKTKCIICTKPACLKKGLKLIKVSTDDRESKIYAKSKELATEYPDILFRIDEDGTKPIDMVANNVHYHSNCLATFLKKKPTDHSPTDVYADAFTLFLQNVEQSLKQGKVWLSSNLTDIYREQLIQVGVDQASAKTYRTQCLKRRMVNYFKDIIFYQSQVGVAEYVFLNSAVSGGALLKAIECINKDIEANYVPILDSESDESEGEDNEHRPMSSSSGQYHIYHAAQQIKSDLSKLMASSKSQDHESPEASVPSKSLDLESGSQQIPDAIYNLVAHILSPETLEDFEESRVKINDMHLHRDIVFLAQDLIHTATGKPMPKHVAIALYIYHKTRSKDIITMLNRFGNSCSYDVMQRILTSVADKIQGALDEDGIFIPDNITQDGLIQFAIDNLDFTKISSPSGASLHVTSMAAFQSGTDMTAGRFGAIPKVVGRGKALKKILMKPDMKLKSAKRVLRKLRPQAEPMDAKSLLECSTSDIPNLDICWMLARLCPTKLIDIEIDSTAQIPGYKAFCARISDHLASPTTVGYMPFLPFSPTSEAVVSEALQICMRTSRKLGHEYTIVTQDLAVYEISYGLRHANPAEYDNLILRLGGFHMEMNFLGTIGCLMKDSGLEDIFVKSKILLTGTANKVMQGSGYYQAMNAHTTVYEGMLVSWWEAFENWCIEEDKNIIPIINLGQILENSILSRELIQDMDKQLEEARSIFREFDHSRSEIATHKLWCMYIEMVEIALQFLHAERDGIWEEHLTATSRMLPFMASAGHHKYATQVVNYLSDMRNLPEPIASHFREGHFSVKQAEGQFTGVWTDMALECGPNANAKGRRGIAGISGNVFRPEAQEKWILTLPFTTEVVTTVRDMLDMGSTDQLQKHHEDNAAVIGRQRRDRDNVVSVVEEFVNPFTYQDADLINIISGAVASDDVRDQLIQAKTIGMTAVEKYILSTAKKMDIVKLQTFASMSKKKKKTSAASRAKDKLTTEITTLKRALLSKREESEEKILQLAQHELLPYPPALAEVSVSGEVSLRSGTKSSLLKCFMQELELEEWPTNIPDSDTDENDGESTSYVVDLMGFIRCVAPQPNEPAQLFAKRVLQRILSLRPAGCSNIHIVADRYDGIGDSGVSLKDASGCHSRRTKQQSASFKLNPNRPITDWAGILSNKQNKQELLRVLFESWEEHGSSWIQSGLTVYLAGGFTNRLKSIALTSMAVHEIPELSSTHEEGDTRVLLHAMYAAQHGATRIVTRANDTDIVIINIFFFGKLADLGLEELYIEINEKYIPIHTLAQTLEQNESAMLPLVHALSGSDTTSFLYGKGKKTFLSRCRKFLKDELASLCLDIQSGISDDVIKRSLEVATDLLIIVYGKRAGDYPSANQLRANMYGRSVDLRCLPPTDDAYRQHVLRALLQTAVWVRAHQAKPIYPNIFDFGWQRKADIVMPILMTEPSAPEDLTASAYCTCTGKCIRGCICRDIGNCSIMCACGAKVATCSLTLNQLNDIDD